MSEPNILLDALLAEASVSHAGLAARINKATATARRPTRYDHTAVARWVRDNAIPRGDVPEIICEVIGPKVGRVLALADIGMARTASDDCEMELPKAVDQAVALWHGDLGNKVFPVGASLIEGSAAIAPVFEWENPPHEIDVSRRGPRPVSMDDVQVLKDARSRYEQMYRRVGGVPVRPRLVAFLNNSVTPLLRGSHDDEIGRRLFRAAGGLVALAGICAYDSDRQATLALILPERGELEQAASTAESMLDCTVGMESERLAERIESVATALSAYDTQPVKAFVARARQQAGIPL
ncbi:hypothetical protein ACTMTI_22330 [Nonomuraea sp. H19]|uniref:hypothetical protein n=1 Tax=Nonomuraea sp. H19 TaxID=3452206 RepID=UPI003F88DA91